MQIEERAVGDVMVLDLKGRVTLGEGDELLKDKVNSLAQSGPEEARPEPGRSALHRQRGARRDRADLHDRQPAGRQPQAAEPDQAHHRSSLDHQAADRLRDVRLGERTRSRAFRRRPRSRPVARARWRAAPIGSERSPMRRPRSRTRRAPGLRLESHPFAPARSVDQEPAGLRRADLRASAVRSRSRALRIGSLSSSSARSRAWSISSTTWWTARAIGDIRSSSRGRSRRAWSRCRWRLPTAVLLAGSGRSRRSFASGPLFRPRRRRLPRAPGCSTRGRSSTSSSSTC